MSGGSRYRAYMQTSAFCRSTIVDYLSNSALLQTTERLALTYMWRSHIRMCWEVLLSEYWYLTASYRSTSLAHQSLI